MPCSRGTALERRRRTTRMTALARSQLLKPTAPLPDHGCPQRRILLVWHSMGKYVWLRRVTKAHCVRNVTSIFVLLFADSRHAVYLLHAYDYCPHDPMICLCLAIASMGRAMQRQADNRHHLITQVSRNLPRSSGRYNRSPV